MELLVRWFVDGVLACLGHLQDGTWNYTPSFFRWWFDAWCWYTVWWLKVGRNQQLGIPQVARFFFSKPLETSLPTRPSFLVWCVEYLRCSSCTVFFIWWSLAWTWGQRLASQGARGQLSKLCFSADFFHFNKCLHWDQRTTAKQIEVTSFFMDNQVFISDLSHEKDHWSFWCQFQTLEDGDDRIIRKNSSVFCSKDVKPSPKHVFRLWILIFSSVNHQVLWRNLPKNLAVKVFCWQWGWGQH